MTGAAGGRDMDELDRVALAFDDGEAVVAMRVNTLLGEYQLFMSSRPSDLTINLTIQCPRRRGNQ